MTAAINAVSFGLSLGNCWLVGGSLLEGENFSKWGDSPAPIPLVEKTLTPGGDSNI